MLVQCCDCSNFIPDDIGDGQGIVKCKKLEDFKAKGASKKSVVRAFNRYLGGKVFWGGLGEPNRNCSRYIDKRNPVIALTKYRQGK